MMRRSVTLAIMACGACAAACSNSTRADTPFTHASLAAQIPIGPIPGPRAERRDVSNPLQGDATAARDGRRAFMQFNCYGCHGGHGGGGMGPSLRDPDWIYGSSPALIFDAIARGRANGMPSWGERLSEADIWHLVTYIQTLATSDEPEPPR
jgi:cytochrome c oxidase cbb3-type subunit 3